MDMSEAVTTVGPERVWLPTAGIHAGVPNDLYHADKTATSSSRLKSILVSPAHFVAGESNKETSAKAFGSALHCLLLEPELFHDQYLVIRPFKKTTKAGQALAELVEEAAGGREIISEADFAEMQAMVASAMRHGAVRALLERGAAETTFVWQDAETEQLLKVRTDWIQPGFAIGDAKSAADASFEGFSRACAKYGYHISAAMYRIGVHVVTGEWLPFRFIALEKEPPYAVAVYEADADFLRRGEKEFRKAVRLLAECRRTGEWPSYQRDEVGLIGLPPWA